MAVPGGGRRFFRLAVLAASTGVPPALADLAVPAGVIAWQDHVQTHLARLPHVLSWYLVAGVVSGFLLALPEWPSGTWAMVQKFGVWIVSVALTAGVLLVVDAVVYLGPGLSLVLLVGGFIAVFGTLHWAWYHRFPVRRLTTHGSAVWETLASAIRRGRILLKGRVLADSFGFALGRMTGASRRYDGRLRYMGHVLTCAPTRAGKGIGAVIPTLLEYPGSCLVMDIKGENYAVTARARRELGQDICLVDPFGVTGAPSQALNWLDVVDLSSPDCIGHAATLAEMLVVIEPGASDAGAYFGGLARTLLQGLILHVAGLEDPAQRTIVEVRRLLTLPLTSEDPSRETLGQVLSEMSLDSLAAYGKLARAADTFLGAEPKEKGMTLSTAKLNTDFLDDPRIAEVLSRSDFRLSDLKKKAMTVYVVMPSDKIEVYARFLRGFIGQSLSAVTASATKPKYQVLFLLDEFGQLGRMKAVENAMSLVRGYGAAFWLFVQDLSQLKGVYPKWQTFLANSAQQFFATADLDTARYISERLGDETIQYETEGSSNPAGWFAKGPGSDSRSGHYSGRRLLTPDEVMRLPKSTAVVLIAGEAPYALNRLNYLQDAEYAGQFDGNPYHN